MKIQFLGESFGVDGLTDGKIYEATIEPLRYVDYFRVIDDSEEDYLYFINNPRPLNGSGKGGYWKIIECTDKERKTLLEACEEYDYTLYWE